MNLPVADANVDTDERLRHFQGCYSALMMGCATSNDKVTAPAMEVYWLVLRELPMDAIEQATQQLLRTSQWFPSTAEFYDVASRLATAAAELTPMKSLPPAPLSDDEQRAAARELQDCIQSLRDQNTPTSLGIAEFLSRQPLPTTTAPAHECATCQDTSWRPVVEDGIDKVTRCACVETNSVIQRDRARKQRFKRGDR